MNKDYLKTDQGILTNSGVWVDVFNLKPENIYIKDIAYALGMNCRFNGHTKTFYSVAEHSLWVANQLPPEHQLAGLLHDASEAYITDVPAPFKQFLPEYKLLEMNIMKVIAKRFKFDYPMHPLVKKADVDALEYEWNNTMIEDNLVGFSTETATEFFLQKFFDLTTKK